MLGTNPNLLFEDGPGPVLGPVGGEFQPSFETVHPGGGAHLFSVLHSIFVSKETWEALHFVGCVDPQQRQPVSDYFADRFHEDQPPTA